jgi:hypothetical protein
MFISNKSGIIPKKIMVEAVSRNLKKCVHATFISTKHQDFTRMNDFYKQVGRQLAVMPVTAYMNIVSHRTGEISRILIPDVVAIFATVAAFDCKPSDWYADD